MVFIPSELPAEPGLTVVSEVLPLPPFELQESIVNNKIAAIIFFILYDQGFAVHNPSNYLSISLPAEFVGTAGGNIKKTGSRTPDFHRWSTAACYREHLLKLFLRLRTYYPFNN